MDWVTHAIRARPSHSVHIWQKCSSKATQSLSLLAMAHAGIEMFKRFLGLYMNYIYVYNSYDGLWWYLNHGVNYLHTASNGSFNLPAAKPWEMFHLYPSQHYEDSQVPLVFFEPIAETPNIDWTHPWDSQKARPRRFTAPWSMLRANNFAQDASVQRACRWQRKAGIFPMFGHT